MIRLRLRVCEGDSGNGMKAGVSCMGVDVGHGGDCVVSLSHFAILL